MNLITIDKEKLVKKIMANKMDHVKEYGKAMYGYQVAVHLELTNLVKIAATKLYTQVKLNTVAPISYIKKYEEILSMLEFEMNDTIELTTYEFRQYVLNQWDWTESFRLSNTGNIGIGNDNPDYFVNINS